MGQWDCRMSNDLFKQNPEISERGVEDVVFLVNSDSETVFHLNELGTAVWRMFTDPTTIHQAITVVQQAFPESDHRKIKHDVDRLIDDLAKQNLLIRPEVHLALSALGRTGGND